MSDESTPPFTLLKLTDAEDMAAKHGQSEMGEVRFPNRELELEQTGLSHHKLRPDARQAFGHRHEDAEEVYVVLSGSGRVKLDEEIIELGELDALRVAPQVTRNFEAGPDGLELLAFGARHEGDGEVIPGWWSD
jgi:mannose-6-phosphate isomerase-like protein (cupin superfamily)